MKIRTLILAIIGAGFASTLAQAAGPNAAPKTNKGAAQPPAFLSVDALKQHMSLTNARTATFNLDPAVLGPRKIDLNLDDNAYSLRIAPYSVFAEDGHVLIADQIGLHEIAIPEQHTYRGVVADANGNVLPGSTVAANIDIDGRLTAFIAMADGTTWFVQPVKDANPAAASSDHFIYKGSETIPTNYRCGVVTIPGAPTPADDGGNPRLTGLKIFDCGLEVDFPLFQIDGSSVPAAITDVANLVNGYNIIYERDVQISWELSNLIIRTTTDPYTSSDPNTLLTQFQTKWTSPPENALRRDVAHLLTGRDLLNTSGGVIGLTFTGAVCNFSFEYGISQTKFTGNFNQRLALTAHEVGHSWNAQHCDDQGSACHIMCSFINGCGGIGAPNFGTFEAAQIVAFRNSINCIIDMPDPITPPFSDTVPNNTLDPTKWTYANAFAVNSNATGIPSTPFAIDLNGTNSVDYTNGDVRTNFIKLALSQSTNVSYRTEHRGVTNGHQLIVEYWGSNHQWVTLNTINSDGVDQSAFQTWEHALTTANNPLAFHDRFRLRFRSLVNGLTEHWYLDNFSVSSTSSDFNSPTPNPMSFLSPPQGASTTSITMTAVTASDTETPPVEYFFQYRFGAGGNTSGWIGSSTYVDTGLTPNANRAYRCQARDSAPTPNVTGFSGDFTGATLIESPTGISIGTVTDTSIDVTALGTFTNLSSPSSGIFYEITPALGSGGNVWTTNTTQSITGLNPATLYTIRVKSRNRNSQENAFVGPVQVATSGNCITPGDINSDLLVDGNDIAGFIRVKLGIALPSDIASCADFGNAGDLDLDTAAFVNLLLQ